MNRRDLVRKIVVGGAVLVLVPSALKSCTKAPATDPGGNPPGTKLTLDLSLSNNSALNTVGGSMTVSNIIITNTGNSNFSALSNVCTHQGCPVVFVSAAGNIQCPCHGSVFSVTGAVIQGPASSPLHTYPASLTGNILTISF
jgi:cytochrome b6-f complex iron-sulfur subunit